MKIAVVVSDRGAAQSVGGNVEHTFKSFDLPPDIEAYVKARLESPYAIVSLVLKYEVIGAKA